jgi:methylated-DNA-[protein]-cysteine S-methyltransferase
MCMSGSVHDHDPVIDSPLGRLGIRLDGDALCRLDFLPASTPLRPATGRAGRQVVEALQHYFADPEQRFSLALRPAGTLFQQRVWSALRTIPAGETLTYGELAARLDSGARAVGNACRRNPIPVIVPCHRVVAARGMGGYAGRTGDRAIWRKRWLLEHEA